ncbi:MAG: BON domain-containing protein [Pseudomonadota bacterium]
MRQAVVGVLVVLWLAVLAGPAGAQELRRNPFGDPFLRITSGLAACPAPEEPVFTEEEFRAEAHDRSQRGVSCWMAGRCRLHNAYLYDQEIVPRVEKALQADGRFGAGTSVWALGQRRYVWLKGCVQSAGQAAEIERIVRLLDDVEGVHNQLMVGTEGPPPYRVAR